MKIQVQCKCQDVRQYSFDDEKTGKPVFITEVKCQDEESGEVFTFNRKDEQADMPVPEKDTETTVTLRMYPEYTNKNKPRLSVVDFE